MAQTQGMAGLVRCRFRNVLFAIAQVLRKDERRLVIVAGIIKHPHVGDAAVRAEVTADWAD